MLINLSNHPLARWSEKQRQTAEHQFGKIMDLPFPAIPTQADLEDVVRLVEKYIEKCTNILNNHGKLKSSAIHIMGEMTFVYQFVQKMSEQGVSCVASTSERVAVEQLDGTKLSRFEFVQFRPYTVELF